MKYWTVGNRLEAMGIRDKQYLSKSTRCLSRASLYYPQSEIIIPTPLFLTPCI